MLSCFGHVQLFATLWTVALQVPLPMGFSRQEYQSGLPCPPPEDLSDPGTKTASLMSPALAGSSLLLAPPRITMFISIFYAVQFSSVTRSCLTLCDPMGCSKPGFPVYHQLAELSQTQVHWVGDAIQPTFSSSVTASLPDFNLSQYQGLFQWLSFLHQVAKVLEIQLQHPSFQWILFTQ